MYHNSTTRIETRGTSNSRTIISPDAAPGIDEASTIPSASSGDGDTKETDEDEHGEGWVEDEGGAEDEGGVEEGEAEEEGGVVEEEEATWVRRERHNLVYHCQYQELQELANACACVAAYHPCVLEFLCPDADADAYASS